MSILKPVKLGIAPVRRNDPYFPDKLSLANKTPLFNKLETMDICYVDIDDICRDGIMSTVDDMEKVAKKFIDEGVEALFIPNMTFGAEDASILLAKKLGVPVLIWGPRDPEGRGATGKPGLGIYTIGKGLRRMRVPFSFMGTCNPDEELFEKGLRNFLSAARVVREVKKARILQIGQRPEAFWSVIVNEGELMEKFGIQVFPLSLPEMFAEFDEVWLNNQAEIKKITEYYKANTVIRTNDEIVEKSACLSIVLENLCKKTHCTAIAIQCWNEISKRLGIWPCAAGSLLSEKGIPMACEGDVHGAISMIIAQAASETCEDPILYDFDFAHPTKPNTFNVHHCAANRISSFESTPAFFRRPVPADKDWGGCLAGELKTSGKVTFLRFDGDNGEYSVLLGNGKATSGPDASNKCSWGWYEVKDWPKLENILVTGPYIHHGVIIYDDILPAVYEAAKYLDFKPDFAFEEEEKATERFMYDV